MSKHSSLYLSAKDFDERFKPIINPSSIRAKNLTVEDAQKLPLLEYIKLERKGDL